MALDGFDYSWARPDPKQMAAAGIKVVSRYLFSGGKGVTRAEVDALHAAGIGVVLNYEANAGDHLLGAHQGGVNGNNARAYAAELGAPPGIPIYYSCDQEVSLKAMPTVLAYLRATDSILHPSRCYAQYSVVEAFGRPGWQTIAWSYGNVSPHAVLHQYAINQTFNGSAVDYNSILNAPLLGAWWPTGAAPESPDSNDAQPITDTSEEDDMRYLIFSYEGALWVTDPGRSGKSAFKDNPSYKNWKVSCAKLGVKLTAVTFSAQDAKSIPIWK